MSIFGVDSKNLSKQQKIKRLREVSQKAEADLEHVDVVVSAAANFTVGSALLEQGKVLKALEYLQIAANKQSQNPQYLAVLAKANLMLRNEAKARAFAESAMSLDQELSPEIAYTLGYVFTRLGNHGVALGLFEKAVELELENKDYLDNLAQSYVFLGKNEAAINLYDTVLRLDAGSGKAFLGLADLEKPTLEKNRLGQLKDAMSQSTSLREKIRIGFALGKTYEALGQWDNAFKSFDQANSDFMAKLKFNVADDERLIDTFKSVYLNDLKQQNSNIKDEVLFVVGIPRTGTTLVDRILSAHSKVVSAGELQSMPLAVKLASATNSKIVLDEDTIIKAGRADIEAVGRAYLDNARIHEGANHGIVFTDKLPLNFMYAGFILKALPNAKIVCLRREPMDTVWSNYKHLFGGGARYHTYSYDLISIARFYIAYKQITDFWAQEFPERFMVLDYENLVADQRLYTQQLLSHCGLDWEEGCLDFHSSTKAVATPSASQVRKPLYSGSIGKWTNYAEQLEEVRAFFEADDVIG
ncbi:tetratricopeptide repeat-containing sulfotransferase family protein [Hirschia maritima]|uniref:tetratricopeptide repeat-containing sulfotransferase family protein n=1 Tax=Hirschia maritima TaxID=1121961 RepID=UPI00035FF21C|nr:sulfotransferase [Hirschia maritima]